MDPKNVQIIQKNDHKWLFFYIFYTFLFGYNTVISALDSNYSVIKRLLCILVTCHRFLSSLCSSKNTN